MSSTGHKGGDDYQVRIGLVLKGSRRLNFLERAIAADWVVEVFKLAPKGAGVEKILFLNGTHRSSHVGSERGHPMSDLIREKVVWLISDDGEFHWSYTFKKPKEVIAIWLSSDGDDTGSRFNVKFRSLDLITGEATNALSEGRPSLDHISVLEK